MLTSTWTSVLLLVCVGALLLALGCAVAEFPIECLAMYAVGCLTALALAVGAGYGPTALFGTTTFLVLVAFFGYAMMRGGRK